MEDLEMSGPVSAYQPPPDAPLQLMITFLPTCVFVVRGLHLGCHAFSLLALGEN